ncbi:ABC transporter permease [Pontibacillus salicampi]|uniref:ABC transporter permease n=1 Tax=Pontibacillus salicampi TaxID=1449801 RepID=A0ABV6LM35_9BACI
MNGFSFWLNEWRAIRRRPGPLFLSLFIPFAFLCLLFITITSLFQGTTSNIQVAVVDKDNTFETKSLLYQLTEEEQMKDALVLDKMSENEAEEAFRQSDVDAIMHIPQGFTKSLRVGENTPIRVTTNSENAYAQSMIETLFSSGAAYISAAQSAVNTVYDKKLSDQPLHERKEQLEAVIVNYTVFALTRNEAFELQAIPLGAQIGWRSHGIIAGFVMYVLLFGVLFQLLENKRYEHKLMHRLRSFHITEIHMYMFHAWKWLAASIGTALLLYCLIASEAFPPYIPLSIEGLTTIAFIGLFTGCLLAAVEGIFSNVWWRCCVVLLLFIIGAGAGGIFVPSIYLPEYIQFYWNPYTVMYNMLEQLFLRSDFMYAQSFILTLWCIGLWLIGWLGAVRKERRYGYLPFTPSS